MAVVWPGLPKRYMYKKLAQTFSLAILLFVDDSQCIRKLLERAFQNIVNRKNPFTINQTASKNVYTDFLFWKPCCWAAC